MSAETIYGRWVLIKGYRDNGAIEAVYGPYSKEYADWLYANFCDNTIYAWTMLEATGPMDTPDRGQVPT